VLSRRFIGPSIVSHRLHMYVTQQEEHSSALHGGSRAAQ